MRCAVHAPPLLNVFGHNCTVLDRVFQSGNEEELSCKLEFEPLFDRIVFRCTPYGPCVKFIAWSKSKRRVPHDIGNGRDWTKEARCLCVLGPAILHTVSPRPAGNPVVYQCHVDIVQGSRDRRLRDRDCDRGLGVLKGGMNWHLLRVPRKLRGWRYESSAGVFKYLDAFVEIGCRFGSSEPSNEHIR